MPKLTYRRKLLLYYFSIFIILLGITGTFQYIREKTFKTEQLETRLNDLVEMTRKHIEKYQILDHGTYHLLDSITYLFPTQDARITVISSNGVVMYDNSISDYQNLDNHSNRPEVIEAKQNGTGVRIRKSSSTGKEYYYYTKKIGNYFIRSSVIYDVTISNFLKANRLFFYFILTTFFFTWTLLWLVTKKFASSIFNLQQFAVQMSSNQSIDGNLTFKDDEIGVIGQQISKIYQDLKTTQRELSVEKERIFRHLNTVNQGISIFSSDKKLLINNPNFLIIANLFSDTPLHHPEDIFNLPIVNKLNLFIDKKLQHPIQIPFKQKAEKHIKIQKDGRYFSLRGIVFEDRSFEIIITNITKKEKNKNIKLQMTSNIAHELKTPVSSIQAYLETIITKPDLEDNIRTRFLNKAYHQVERLGLLIHDISTVYKMQSPHVDFERKAINLHDLIEDLKEESQLRRAEKNIQFTHDLHPKLILTANLDLILSIFQNLIDNSIKYAGEDVTIHISMYKEDDKYFHFEYSDDGAGISEQHLDRIFERFYRVDSGRTRKDGGTGIGLAIVKNAIKLHSGTISAKPKKDRGISFLFTIRKNETRMM